MLERAQAAEDVEVVQAAETGRDLSGAGSDGRLIGLWLHGKSPATKEAYRSDLAKFSDFTEGKPLRTVTLTDVQEFADFLSGLLAPASQARILAALQSLYSPAVASPLHPLAHRSLAYAQGFGYPLLGPSLLLEFEGPQTPSFTPVGGFS